MNELEINTRINTIVAQRNDALNGVALLNGQLAILKVENEDLKKKLNGSELDSEEVSVEDLDEVA